MRSLILVGLLVAAATFTSVARVEEPQAIAAPSTLLAAPAAPQEAPRVTIRVGGARDDVRVGPSQQPQGRKGLVQNPGLDRRPDRPGHTVLTVEGQGVSLADQGTSGEGRLTRIHIDADDDLTAVIGFYSTIDADQPVINPDTYSCKRCGSVMVCAVDPQCAN